MQETGTHHASIRRLAEICEAIAATTKKLQKTALMADHLKSLSPDSAATSAVFLSGKPFPAWEETTLQVGGSLLWKVVQELSRANVTALNAAYRKHGDLGAVAGEVLPDHRQDHDENNLTVLDLTAKFREIASARGAAAKSALVRDLLKQATPLEAKYIIKIMTGDLRIGLKESLVEEGIAKAYASTLVEVQRANMLLGDIGETTLLAIAGKLASAKMRLFHPIGFMLASPIELLEEGFTYFPDAAVEDKYDGIRAQAHVANGEVKLFSRTRDEITESFPELPYPLARLPHDAILDGEIVAWEYPADHRINSGILPPETNAIEVRACTIVDEPFSESAEAKAANLGRARPFTALQQRLGRKKVSARMLRENPVAYLAFDVLYANGELLIDRPLRERARILDGLLLDLNLGRDQATASPSAAPAPLRHSSATQHQLLFESKDSHPPAEAIRAPVFRAASSHELDELFSAARARGNEGLMIKDLNSPYVPGKRGKSWLKMKRELATLDVVVTGVEFGHGKRVGVLSDYTFAVWDTKKDRLLNIGKAYSGLTDVEIVEMTQWFLEHTLEDQGFHRTVEPKIVLEVAFNNMMKSDRHESGYALRFPRIVRLRPDKNADDADTIERVREIFERQTQ